MKLNEVIELDQKYYMNTFGNRTPVCFTHGEGINLWDTENKKYVDFLGGIAVNTLGHAHPALVDAICSQAKKLIHCSSLYYIEAQSRLAQMLADNSCADRVFFANSGAEANEGAIKLARIYFKKKGLSDKFEIISLEKSFHGRTVTTTAATGQEKFKKYYQPLTPGFSHVPLNDFEALEKAITPSTCAILIEPIQGESGVNPAQKEYLQKVRKLCDEKDVLLIFDEIQCGLGRCGTLFAYQYFGVEPDIFTLAKGLAGGVPIGALCAKQFVAEAFEPGDHGSTFGGNPLACSAGIAVLETIFGDKLIENAKKTGEYFINKINELKEKCELISKVRGVGLMIGIVLKSGVAVDLKNKLFEKGYLVGSVSSDVIRILPPLIITKEDVDDFIKTFEEIL